MQAENSQLPVVEIHISSEHDGPMACITEGEPHFVAVREGGADCLQQTFRRREVAMPETPICAVREDAITLRLRGTGPLDDNS